ncbi:type 1 glutamine amidotransferase [uncultured Methylobacterium sp.]|uniref:type 1 glutamine amidotransferase n=1 Tax=uncultured Methylobacterium sp. TaxID=157278 RepID=UPI0035CAC8BD
MLRLLIADGNDRAGRAHRVAIAGRTTADAYAGVVADLMPHAVCVTVNPADADAALPEGAGLGDFDGLILTGSSLRVGDGTPAVRRQLDLMRATFEAGLPSFGSCWGMQVAAVVAGGEAGRNPRGPEYGFARRIVATPEGRAHPLLAGRAPAWDAPAIHLDAVLAAPPGSVVLAENAVLDVQAIAIRYRGGLFQGTQYHPETDLDELAATLGASADDVIAAGLAPDAAAVEAHCAEIAALHAAPEAERRAAAWRLGLGPDVLEARCRRLEIANFLENLSKGTASPRAAATGWRVDRAGNGPSFALAGRHGSEYRSP